MKGLDELTKTSYEIIDKQHKGLTDAINEYILADDSRPDKYNFFIEKLSGLSKEHFETEEMLMIQSGYENYYSHKMEHDRFLRKLFSFSFDNREMLFGFLRDWLQSHLELKDMKLTQFLIQTNFQKASSQ